VEKIRGENTLAKDEHAKILSEHGDVADLRKRLLDLEVEVTSGRQSMKNAEQAKI